MIMEESRFLRVVPRCELQGECVGRHRHACGRHFDGFWMVTGHVEVLENVRQQLECEAAHEVLSDAGSLANREGKEVWNVFLDPNDARAVRCRVFSHLVRGHGFKESLGPELFWAVPVLLARVQLVVVDEDYRVLKHAITADLRVLRRHMRHNW